MTKTPEQVATDLIGQDALAGVGYQKDFDLAVKAIEADRAQRVVTVEEALDVLHRESVVYKAWVLEDLEMTIRQMMADGELPQDTDVDALAAEASGTGHWSDLADSTEQDWERVAMAIGEAAGIG